MTDRGAVPVRRVYVEKRAGFDLEARILKRELSEVLAAAGLGTLTGLRILRRYDAAGIEKEVFDRAVSLVFSDPAQDEVFAGYEPPVGADERWFALEYLPGQYDQRSDSAEQCVALLSGVRPEVKTATVYAVRGNPLVSDAACAALKAYLINPVDSREASLSFHREEPPEVRDVPVVKGFARGTCDAGAYGLALSHGDLRFCQAYFSSCGRDPTLAELRVIDAYWSDHCRHTTFTTALDSIEVTAADGPLAPEIQNALRLYEEARELVYPHDAPPRSLMDMATIGAKVLKTRGRLRDADESKEINACALRVEAAFDDGSTEPWLLLFKNETHNHPTEIEPVGGAATCLGGAVRDPLSGRAFVYQALRISGSADPREGASETLPGKLPQLTIARGAAKGYASYGNQIGIATGQVAELYHRGFLAKHLELGAVLGAVPRSWVRREDPAAGDAVALIGGKTGRDGIGGATGSSKVHTGDSVRSSGAEVQKGNPLEERKLQRLFRNPQVTRLIKRCNDFGAGGAAVAVGEIAPGVSIDLDAIPRKYAGLDGTELALSESQERMAAVVSPEHAETLIRYAAAENLDAAVIGLVTSGDGPEAGREPYDPKTPDAGPRLTMTWRGKTVVDLSRRFLDTNGVPRSARAALPSHVRPASAAPSAAATALQRLEAELGSLRSGSRRGLTERFDGSVGADSVLFPWGGAEQGTPECGMASLLPVLEPQKTCRTASLMTFGCDPALGARNPYLGARGAVLEALTKFACLGGNPFQSRLSFEEYFPRPETPETWGLPVAALLGALEAQIELEVPAIGGKDSMSGTYRDLSRGIDLSVPPTFAAFAVGTVNAARVRSGALSGAAGNHILLLYQRGKKREKPLAAFRDTLSLFGAISHTVVSAYPVGAGGIAAALAVMAFGNMTGVEALGRHLDLVDHESCYGAALLEISADRLAEAEAVLKDEQDGRYGAAWERVARTVREPVFRVVHERATESCSLEELRRAYEAPLAQVYPQTSDAEDTQKTVPLSVALAAAQGAAAAPSYKEKVLTVFPQISRPPLVVLPVFPGTNCEWDMERAFRRVGAEVRQVVFRNRTPEDVENSLSEVARAVREARIVGLSGGFSAGDEPDGSGKFIAAVFRSPLVRDAVTDFLEKRDGFMLGICNGFQALVKLGLLPYGTYREPDPSMPTLTFNAIGRHVSRMVRTTVVSVSSPWLSLETVGAVHVIPVSHGEGRLVIREDEAAALFRAGQVPFCYADRAGRIALGEPDNPNGSAFGIEGLTDPSGRILGKMGHSERRGLFTHRNIPGSKRQHLFEAAAGPSPTASAWPRVVSK
ncbi:MAG: phosphoribosylformylglycinamidine synthase [Spirochaetaceae bacterium]|jgi:phosphoribosylformylglycinamidine synthase|nr:phosphoribosylformylglycinamidine synthase [Spirochaetaceae bacterium]